MHDREKHFHFHSQSIFPPNRSSILNSQLHLQQNGCILNFHINTIPFQLKCKNYFNFISISNWFYSLFAFENNRSDNSIEYIALQVHKNVDKNQFNLITTLNELLNDIKTPKYRCYNSFKHATYFLC